MTYTGKETLSSSIVYSDHSANSGRWWGRNPHVGLSDPKAHAGPSTMPPPQPNKCKKLLSKDIFYLSISKWAGGGGGNSPTNILRPDLQIYYCWVIHAVLILKAYFIKICLPNGDLLGTQWVLCQYVQAARKALARPWKWLLALAHPNTWHFSSWVLERHRCLEV